MAAPQAAGEQAGSQNQHTLNLTPEQLAGLEKLRAPFPPESIAKRPQIRCAGCRNHADKVCSVHTKSTCKDCGQYVTNAHKHLDYVGHAETTDRLLEVDITWDWEPMAKDANGLPLIDHSGGMWITLTVCGMTRKGYGDAVGKPANTTATKEIIGDAIRNAGMRFGMALDLWAKTALHVEAPHPAEPFIDAIKQERVWTSSEYLAGLRKEADEAGQLDFAMPRGGGKTLGDVIDAQLLVLEDAAQRYAEMRLKHDQEREARAAERAAAQAQIAREHGVTPNPNRLPVALPPGEDGMAPWTAAEVRQKAVAVWQDDAGLERVLTGAQVSNVANEPANLAYPDGLTLGEAIRQQINGIRERQRDGATGRAAYAAGADQQQVGGAVA
jgi:hypothetical protein